MRTKKIALGAIAEVIPYLIIGILGIVKVKVLITYLGDITNGYYQFINSAITYIFMAEAGFTSAVIFAMYKYFANKDEEGIRNLFAGAKKIFRYIGFLIVGLILVMAICIPIFFIQNGEYSFIITVCFLIISGSYLLAFFGPSNSYYTVFCADQKKYLYSIIFNTLKIISDLAIIFVIIVTHSLIVLALTILIVKVLEQIIIYLVGRKHYPYLSEKAIPDTSPFAMTKDLIWHQFGYLASNNIDTIILMLVNGPFVVSIYTTYNFIARFLTEIANKINGVVVHSFGNVFVKEDENRSYQLFKEYRALCTLIAFMFSIPFLLGIRSFVGIWINNINYLLSYKIMVIFALNLFLTISYLPLVSSIYSNGLYKESKYYVFSGAVLNLVLSIILVNIYGIGGVLIATSISYMYTIFLRSKLTAEKVFSNKMNNLKFFSYYIIIAAIFVGVAIALNPIEIIILNIDNIIYMLCSLFLIFIVVTFITTIIMLIFKSPIRNTIFRIKSLVKK